MTWGQLRLSLQTSAPGVSLDLIDEFLNVRYEQVLEHTDWSGLKYHATITTQAAYQSSTDTVTLTVGSASVAGASTNWTSARVGQKFYRPGDSVIYTVSAVGGTTALTLDRAYEGNGVDASGTVYAGSSYVFMQNVYALPADCRSVATALDPVTGFPLTRFEKDRADESWGPRTLVQDPASYAVYDDSNESSPPVVHQIEFFPPPLHARGISIEYLHSATAFDGSTTSGSPLPWVSSSVLLYGCRADIRAYLGDAAGAKLYEAKFQEELARMARLEHAQKRQKVAVQMANRFTRHRLERAGRGLNRTWGPGQGGPF